MDNKDELQTIIEALRDLTVEMEDLKLIVEDIDKTTTDILESNKVKNKEAKITTFKCLCGTMVNKEFRTLHNKTKLHKDAIKKMRGSPVRQ